jgi:multidrug efflux pump subunit AcrB
VNGLISWFARNPVAANLLMVSLILAGLAGSFQVEREVFPSGRFNFAQVTVAWPGASPQEIEEQVVLRVEEAISDIDGVLHVDSTASEGSASFFIEGADEVETTRFLNDIKNRVDGISTFPADSFPPVVRQLTAQDTAVYLALFGDLNEKELNRLARELRNEASRIPGGSPLVTLFGALREEVSIEVSEEALRRYGLTFDDVARAIRGASVTLSGGQVRTDTGNIQVAARNLADSQEDFETIVVRQTQDGAQIRVKDVARVVDGFEDRKVRREVNGKPAVTIAIEAPEKLDIVVLSRAVRKWVDETNKRLEGKATIQIWFDTAEIYFARTQLVTQNAMQGITLVLILLVLFLRPVIAFWVAWGIVVAFAASFIFMPATGVSLNILSLFAFLLVSGIVVDDAIVIGESIHEELEKGGKGVDAAILGAQLVAKPVLFGVLTTIIAFLPWLFIGGGSQQFTKHIAYVAIFALSFSLIEAFFVLPSHVAHLRKQNRDGLAFRLQGLFSEGLVKFADRTYRPLLRFALRARYETAAFFLVCFAVSVALMAQGWISFKFQPEVEGPFISLNVRLPEGTPYARSLEIFDQIEAGVARLKESYTTRNGSDFVRTTFINAAEGEVRSQVTIADTDERPQGLSSERVADAFRELVGPIDDAEDVTVTYTVNDSGADLTFGVESKDLEDLRLATLDIQAYLRAIPGVYDVRNSLQSATPELRIDLKPGAERFGITLSDVTRQVRQAFYGEEVQRLPRDGQDVRVMVRYPADERASLTSVDRMRIRTADGREVPLAAVADLSFQPSYKRIQRRDRSRSAQVTAQIRDGVDRAALNAAFYRDFVPEWSRRHPDASMSRRGAAEEQADFVNKFLLLNAIMLVAMYVLLAIPLASYWQPALIMMAIPFGYMGAAFGHFMFGMEFALFSFFGVGTAAGVVVNDNIVLLHAVNRARAQGAGAAEAMLRSAVGRFRPIFLTSITTFAGLFPIMFTNSIDAEFLKPTVIALTMGIIFALFVTLFFVPAVYCIGADIARFYRWAWTGARGPSVRDEMREFEAAEEKRSFAFEPERRAREASA